MKKFAVLARLSGYIQKYRNQLILGVVCVTLSNLAATLSPLVLKHAIDSLGQSISKDKLLF